VNAPRLLRPVDGDFIAQVTVTNALQPDPGRGSARRRPFNGAGLLLWQDEKNYVRLEFGAFVEEKGATARFALFEHRKNGLPAGGLAQANTRLEARPTGLRLERRDRTLLGFVRQGGHDWTPVGQFEVDLPQQLYVGIAAVNTTQAPFAADFEDFNISSRP